MNLTRQLIADHLVSGEMTLGGEIALRMDQALLQDVLGTLVMLELEAMGIERVVPHPSVQYVDHGLVQSNEIDADAHAFLKSGCERFGIIYSAPGTGISHPVHMTHFGVPGATLVGSDSHTPAAGALGMLAIGAGGVEVAMAMAGEPLYLAMPKVWGVELVGELPDWVSAKDVILELLRRHGVSGARDFVLEYHGPGLDGLSAMDRHVIANMGTELGATSSVFPSDEETRRFLSARGRDADWKPLAANPGATYDRHETIDLSSLVPLVARPQSPDNVVPISEAAGEPIAQAYIGSSANPGYRDFAVVADILDGRRVADGVSLDVNPSSRHVLAQLVATGKLGALIGAGARLHQAGCNGCIGMGQAPATGRNSLRTVPRNFPGRSGTKEDSVFLCSPETAAASALAGVITDPRTLGVPYPRIAEPEHQPLSDAGLVRPKPGHRPPLYQTKHTPSLPEIEPLPDEFAVPVLLSLGDNISTDDIIPAGRILPFWSDVFETQDYAFHHLDGSYPGRAKAAQGGHAIVAGRNYGQGSSRENAALVPRLLGLRLVVARSFARIHWQNLAAFGVLALTVDEPAELPVGTELRVRALRDQVRGGQTVEVEVDGRALALRHELSARQIDVLFAGGIINHVRGQGRGEAA